MSNFGFRLVSLTVIILLPLFAHAELRFNHTGTSIGLAGQYEQAREETLHPLRNQGVGLSLLATWQFRHQQSSSAIYMQLPLGLTADRYGFTALSINYGLSYSQMWDSNSEIKLGYFTQLNVRERYFFEWDDSHFFWLSDWSLGPRFVISPPQFSRLKFTSKLAVFSLVSRSPQTRRNKLDDVTSFSGFFATPQQDLRFMHLPEVLIGELGLRTRSHNNSNYWQYRLQFARTHELLSYVELRHSLGFYYAF